MIKLVQNSFVLKLNKPTYLNSYWWHFHYKIVSDFILGRNSVLVILIKYQHFILNY